MKKPGLISRALINIYIPIEQHPSDSEINKAIASGVIKQFGNFAPSWNNSAEATYLVLPSEKHQYRSVRKLAKFGKNGEILGVSTNE